MKIRSVKLRGFRNFKDATVRLNDHALIIGANDVGKSNLLFALRLLLDRSLSETELEPSDSDFYAREETNELQVLVEFCEVEEDCVGKPEGYRSLQCGPAIRGSGDDATQVEGARVRSRRSP